MGNDYSISSALGFDASLDISTNKALSAACAAFCEAAKLDLALMEDFRRKLDACRAFRDTPEALQDKRTSTMALADSVADGQQRLAMARRAGERLQRAPNCPASVGQQLAELERSWFQLSDLLQQVRTEADEALNGWLVLQAELQRLDSWLAEAEAKLQSLTICRVGLKEMTAQERQLTALQTDLDGAEGAFLRLNLQPSERLASAVDCNEARLRIGTLTSRFNALRQSTSSTLSAMGQSKQDHVAYNDCLEQCKSWAERFANAFAKRSSAPESPDQLVTLNEAQKRLEQSTTACREVASQQDKLNRLAGLGARLQRSAGGNAALCAAVDTEVSELNEQLVRFKAATEEQRKLDQRQVSVSTNLDTFEKAANGARDWMTKTREQLTSLESINEGQQTPQHRKETVQVIQVSMTTDGLVLLRRATDAGEQMKQAAGCWESIQGQMKELWLAWDKLLELRKQVAANLDKATNDMSHMQMELQRLDKWLSDAEAKLEGLSRPRSELEKMTAQEIELTSLKESCASFKPDFERLAQLGIDFSGAAFSRDFELQKRSLLERYKLCSTLIGVKLDELRHSVQQMQAYEEGLRQCTDWIKQRHFAMKAAASTASPGTVDEAQLRVEGLQSVSKEVEDYQSMVDIICSMGQKLTDDEQGNAGRLVNVAVQLTGLRSLFDGVKCDARELLMTGRKQLQLAKYIAEVESSASEIEQWVKDSHRELMACIRALDDRPEALPVEWRQAVKAVTDSMADRRQNLTRAKELAERLTSDASCPDGSTVKRRIEDLECDLSKLSDLLKRVQTRIDDVDIYWKRLQSDSQRLTVWLDNVEGKLDELSEHKVQLEQRLELVTDLKAFKIKVDLKASDFDKLEVHFPSAASLVEALRDRYGRLCQRIKERLCALAESVTEHQAFEEKRLLCVAWIQETLDSIVKESSTLSPDMEEAKKRLELTAKISKEVEDKRSTVDMVLAMGRKLRELDPSNAGLLAATESQLRDLKEQFDSLCDASVQQLTGTKAQQQAIAEVAKFHKAVSEARAWVWRKREDLISCRSVTENLLSHPEKRRMLQEVEDSIPDGESLVAAACSAGERLASSCPERVGTQSEELRQAWSELGDLLQKVQVSVQGRTGEYQEVQAKLKKMELQLTDLDRKLAEIGGPRVDLAERRSQISELTVLQTEFRAFEGRIAEVEKAICDDSTRDLASRLAKLISTAKVMQAQLEKSVDDQEMCEKAMRDSDMWIVQTLDFIINGFEDHCRNATEAAAQLTRYERIFDEIEKYRSEIREVNRLGQSVISGSTEGSALCKRVADQLKRLEESYRNLFAYAKELRPVWQCPKCCYNNPPESKRCTTCNCPDSEPPGEVVERTAVMRVFDCGHWERLDQAVWNRRLSNQFCSRCWSPAFQLQRDKLKQRPVEDTEVKRTRLTKENQDTTVEYHSIWDRVTRYVKPEQKIKVLVESIDRIENPVLDRRLFDVYNDLIKKDCMPQLFIHGTSGDSAEKIIREGFKVGTDGMFGAGIYFATDTAKSVQFCSDQGVKTLLLCEVVLGRSMVCDTAKNFLNLTTVRSEGYDSVFAKRATQATGGVQNDEYIVYRSEQAAPRYLIKFTVT